jgi:hypothetical protein
LTRYDWLLFLHVLAAFAIVGSVVIFSVMLLSARQGGSATLRLTPLAARLFDVGGAGTLILGIWLAIDLDDYHPWDGWILAAIVLWAVAAGTGTQLGRTFQGARGGGEVAVAGRATRLYGVMATAVAALLVVMIFKPGA